MTHQEIIEKVYKAVLHEAKPLYDPDSDQRDVAIFEEAVYRKIEEILTTYRAQVLEEKYKMLDGSTPDVVFINMVKGKQTHTEYLHPTN